MSGACQPVHSAHSNTSQWSSGMAADGSWSGSLCALQSTIARQWGQRADAAFLCGSIQLALAPGTVAGCCIADR